MLIATGVSVNGQRGALGMMRRAGVLSRVEKVPFGQRQHDANTTFDGSGCVPPPAGVAAAEAAALAPSGNC